MTFKTKAPNYYWKKIEKMDEKTAKYLLGMAICNFNAQLRTVDDIENKECFSKTGHIICGSHANAYMIELHNVLVGKSIIDQGDMICQ